MQSLKLRIAGLWPQPNPFSEVPNGSLTAAVNLVIDRESVAQSRRGQRQYGEPFTAIKALLNFNDVILAHDDDSTLYFDSDDAGTFSAYAGTFASPASYCKIRSEVLGDALFFTSDSGIQRLESTTGTPERAGIAAALDMAASLTGGSGFLADAKSVVYRLVFGRRDSNGQLLLGAPSARVEVTNNVGGGATRNVSLTFTLDATLTDDYFYQLYRSEQVTTAGTESDELQLALEKQLTSGDISAGTVTVTDSTIDSSLGAFIYTAASQDGILQENRRPPFATALTSFRQYMIYGNTYQPQRMLVQLNGNFTAADTVVLDGVTYTADTIEVIGTGNFKVGADIAATMRSLIRVINRYTTNTHVYAYEINDSSFFVEYRTLGASSFQLTSARTSAFALTLPLTSDNETHANWIMLSKFQQGHAVPILNYIAVGSGEFRIKNIIALRDALIILKADGAFRMTGTSLENFIVEPIDTKFVAIGDMCSYILDNKVYAMSESGVAAVSADGVDDTVGRAIERTLLPLSVLDNFESTAWAMAYHSDRHFMLSVPQTDIDDYPTKTFVYNHYTKAWTEWTMPIVSGITNARDGKLYLARGDDQQVTQERKDFTLDDYADYEFAVTITGSSGNVVSLSSVPSDVVVGMTLRQDVNDAIILDIDGTDLTVDVSDYPWTAGAATVYQPISLALEWNREDFGNPGVLKHCAEATYLFEDARIEHLTASFNTNFSAGFEEVDLPALGQGAWGEFPWGDEDWGGGVGGDQPIRTYFPQEVARASWVSMRLEGAQAFTDFSLLGVSVMFKLMSERF